MCFSVFICVNMLNFLEGLNGVMVFTLDIFLLRLTEMSKLISIILKGWQSIFRCSFSNVFDTKINFVSVKTTLATRQDT